MYTISISQEIKEACPVFAGAAVYAKAGDASEFLISGLESMEV